jgi:hypothetical protein
LILISLPIHSLERKIPYGSAVKNEDNKHHKNSDGNHIFTGTKLFVFDVLPREKKFNQGPFLVMISPELSKRNTNSRRRVGKNQLVVQIIGSCAIIGTKFESVLLGKK